MAERRFLIVRLGSLGDLIHTLPAAHALRQSFPAARIDWLVDGAWRALLQGNPDLDAVIALERNQWRAWPACLRQLRAGRYDCVLDFQSLYKSAILAFASGAAQRLGFERSYAREGAATLFYTQQVKPQGAHKVEHNLTLAENAGACVAGVSFPVPIDAAASAGIGQELAARGIGEFFVLSPGAGWRAKSWPAERFGELHHEIAQRYGWPGIVSFSPAERALAEAVRRSAGAPAPLLLPMDVAQLAALLERARLVVAADTGPLHLASALGVPVVGIYGPTDPARNGPYSKKDVVVRHAAAQTSYQRDSEYSSSMLAISVAQVLGAVARRLQDA